MSDNYTIIGSDNGLSPGRHQAIICTNTGIFLIKPLGTYFGQLKALNINLFLSKQIPLQVSISWYVQLKT